MAKEKLGKLCPVGLRRNREEHLMIQYWGKEGGIINFRITCENINCSYEPITKQELEKYVENQMMSKERVDFHFPELKEVTDAA